MDSNKPETVAVGSDGLVSQFVAAVTNELHEAGWTVRDDGDSGLPDKMMDTEIARAITKHANILTTDEWKAHRIAMCKAELSLLANDSLETTAIYAHADQAQGVSPLDVPDRLVTTAHNSPVAPPKPRIGTGPSMYGPLKITRPDRPPQKGEYMQAPKEDES